MSFTATQLRADVLPVPDGLRLWLDDDRWLDLHQPPRWLEKHLLHPEVTRAWPGSLDQRGQWGQVATLLQRQGMVTGATAATPLRGLSVGVVGSGIMARQTVLSLSRIGAALVVHDPRPPSSTQWVHSDAPTCGHALQRWLVARQAQAQVRPACDLADLAEASDLVLVLEATVEPDRLAPAELVRLGVPHLVMRLHRDRARLGPLVVPGRTACLGCADRVLAAADPGHAASLARLVGRRCLVEDDLLAAVVARTVLEVRWWQLGRRSRLLDAVETLDLCEPDASPRRLVRHPECSCQLVVAS